MTEAIYLVTGARGLEHSAVLIDSAQGLAQTIDRVACESVRIVVAGFCARTRTDFGRKYLAEGITDLDAGIEIGRTVLRRIT